MPTGLPGSIQIIIYGKGLNPMTTHKIPKAKKPLMKKSIAVSAFLLLAAGSANLYAGSIEDDFKNPPAEAGPYVWWHWMGSNISKEGITKDLEAMKASGIGGATIFNLTSAVQEGAKPTLNLPFPDITYRSPKWWEMVEFAAAEAQRLGLEVGMHNCVGYSATGGPWVTPELSMQKVVFSSTRVKGLATFAGTLPQPRATLDFYRDIAVLAVPDTNPVDPKAVLDLSPQMDKTGRLAWTAPAGDWILYRFGHTSTGAKPAPIPEDVKALEVDKMSASASKFHFEQVINPLREHLGAAMGKSFRHLTLDSYEAGAQNWTPAFRDEFRKRKGYDPVPWLPVLDTTAVGEGKKRTEIPKRTLGTPEQSARFQWDFKDMVARLYQENNFEQGARMMHEAGLMLQFEAYGGPFDTIAGSATADIPMGEFWTGGGGGIGGHIVAAARAADRKVVGAEALTGTPGRSKFSEDPAYLKITGDGGYASGVNRLVLHHWVHQPFGDAFKPGMGMGWWGTHFGRNQTWTEPGKAYYQYLARTQSLLQRGQGIGDFLTLDHAVANADAIPRAVLLRGDVRVENGQIVLSSGRRYPFLALPAGDAMLPEVARKLKELVSAGAIIVGQKPIRSPSLSDYPACDDEVRRIGGELWGDADGRAKLENRIGKGKVFAGSLAPFLEKSGITPPVTFGSQGQKGIRATARRDGDTDIFFISNGTDTPCETTPSFRVSGKLPELWQAETGSHVPALFWREVAGRTEVPLRLRGKEAIFVVFRKPAPAGDHPVNILIGSPVRIIKATFGAFEIGRTVDVTKQLAELVKNDTRQIRVGRGIGSIPDPAPNVVKTLRVEYEIGDKRATAEAKEGDLVSFGDAATSSEWNLAVSATGQPLLLASGSLTGKIVYASGKQVPFSARPPPALAVTGAWEVSFSPGMGAPEKISFPELKPWNDHPDSGIKYFSGTATYRKSIVIPADLPGNGKHLILDLGTVCNLASVKVNGIDLGVGWYAPFRFDATAALKPGANTLEIAVTNTWANRLIGDEQEPADLEWGPERSIFGSGAGRALVAYPDWFIKGQPRPSKGRKAFFNWNYFTKESPLLPAGLLGPVQIIIAEKVSIP